MDEGFKSVLEPKIQEAALIKGNPTIKDSRDQLRVSVGVVTRDRPKLFAKLFDSLMRLSLDNNIAIEFIIVENNTQKTLSKTIAFYQSKMPESSIAYELEPQLGIPYARNRVLDIATDSECDLLAFVDDDETVDEMWLHAIVSEQQGRSLELVGGPVRLQNLSEDVSYLEKIVWEGLVYRNAKKEKAKNQQRSCSQDNLVAVITNNWLIDLKTVRRTGIRFDESFGLSGGSDLDFFCRAKSLGISSGWAIEAIVYDFIPKKRLSLSYQFCRARDQAIANYRIKYPENTPGLLIRCIVNIVYKCLTGLALICLTLLYGGKSLLKGVRSLGTAMGRVAALFGVRSRHYEHVDSQ